MTDDPGQGQDDPFTPRDDRLARELEALYRRVASLDSKEAASDMEEDADPYYKILQIQPDVSLSDIHFAYKRMAGAWDPERYPHVPSWRETSTEKLKEIKNAYEKLLLLHTAPDAADGGDANEPALSTARPPFPANAGREEEAPARATVNGFSRAAFKLRPRLIASGLLIAVILLLASLWPTLYHYDAIHLAGRDYPIRISRLTTHAQYYDGIQWREPPLPAETDRHTHAGMASIPASVELSRIGSPGQSKPVTPPPIESMASQAAPAPVPAQPARSEIRSEPQPAPPSPIKDISPQATFLPQPAGPAAAQGVNQPKPARPVPAKTRMTSPDRFGSKAKTGTSYSIQISAYPDRQKADALAEKMRAARFAVRVDEASIDGKGRWCRVLLGRFEDRRAALRYLEEHRIGETYPGSFIQRTVSPSQ